MLYLGASCGWPLTWRSKKQKSILLGLSAQRSALLVLAEGDGYAASPEVVPFVRQFKCYASQHGLTFLVDTRRYHEPAFFSYPLPDFRTVYVRDTSFDFSKQQQRKIAFL